MTSVIGDQDNGWTSATMHQGKLVEQYRDKVQDIHQESMTKRLPPVSKSVTEQYAESMLGHEVIMCGCMSAGKISVTCEKHQAATAVQETVAESFTPEVAKKLLDEGKEWADKLNPKIKAMQGSGMSQTCGLGLCGTYATCQDCGRSPWPKWPPPVSCLDEEKSLLKELNKPQAIIDSKELPLSDSEQSKTANSPKALDSFHKIPVNLCPASAIIAIAKVISLGHLKPGRTLYNWRSQPISYSSYLGAALRHLLKSNDGSDHDPELSELAGVPIRHDWAAMSCFAIIEDARQAGTLVDDRPVKGGAEKFMESLMVKK